MKHAYNSMMGPVMLPIEIVLAPEWWHKNAGITFDEDFFFHPYRRVKDEKKMEKILYERWGQFGLGEHKDVNRPEIGAVHLAAGYLLSEMLGCKVNYSESHPPQVVPDQREDLTLSDDEAFRSPAYKKLNKTIEGLKSKFGYVTGDINWGGILNLALDLRGENIFTDMMMSPAEVNSYFFSLASVIERFTNIIQDKTGTTSISVNRGVRYFNRPVFLHSECSHTMISQDDYDTFLLPYDIEWSKKRPFGIHYCGTDPHRMATSFSKIPHLDYLDVGWGGDVLLLRKHLPNTFFSIRLSPVELIKMNNEEIVRVVHKLIDDSANPMLTGICCINIDDQVSDDKITTIFKAVEEKRNYNK